MVDFGFAGRRPPETDPRDAETACRFVSSHGLLKSCEVRRDPPDAATRRWPPRLLRGHRAGGRIYVHAEALADFVRRSLPAIRSPFVLVSGDTTVAVGADPAGPDLLRPILEHPHLIHWYVQNAAIAHPKVVPMPVGLDYHSLAAGRKRGWGPQASPRAQEEVLTLVRRAAPALADRDPRGYCTWQFAAGVGGRDAVRAALPADAVHFEPERLARRQSWERTAAHAFTVSPPGRGMDCHRTWEALVLGSIPVVADLPIAPLFRELPVLVVADWADATPDRLARARADLLAREFDFAPLLLAHWTRRMAGEAPVALRMRLQAFLDADPDDLQAALGG